MKFAFADAKIRPLFLCSGSFTIGQSIGFLVLAKKKEVTFLTPRSNGLYFISNERDLIMNIEIFNIELSSSPVCSKTYYAIKLYNKNTDIFCLRLLFHFFL